MKNPPFPNFLIDLAGEAILSDEDFGLLVREFLRSYAGSDCEVTIPEHLKALVLVLKSEAERMRELSETKSERMRALVNRRYQQQDNTSVEQDNTSVYDRIRAYTSVETERKKEKEAKRKIRKMIFPPECPPEGGSADIRPSFFSDSDSPNADLIPFSALSYDTFADPCADAVLLACSVCETKKKTDKATFTMMLEKLGPGPMLYQVKTFWSEIRCGEDCRNRAAALTARLRESAQVKGKRL